MGKTIWIVNQYTGSPIHGMEYRHYYIASELVRQGHRVVVFSGSYSHLYKKQPLINGNYTTEWIDGIEYRWLKVPHYERSVSLKRILNMFAFVWRMRTMAITEIAKPDAIIASSPSPFVIRTASKWAKRFKAKLIFEVRDIWPLTLQELSGLKNSHPLIWLMRQYELFGYRNADYVVSLLPNAKSHFLSSGMHESKFRYIPNGVDLNEISSVEHVSDEFRKQIPTDKFIVGYTGSLGASNAMEYLVEAILLMQNNSEVFFVIVGNGDNKKDLENRCQNCKNVIFIDSVPKKQIPSVLELFDACFIAMHQSKLYQFGVSLNKMFDYMYSGKPLLLSLDSPNNPAEVSGCSLVVTPESPQEIVRGIKQLVSMTSEARKEMGNLGKSYVIDHHTYQALSKKYLDLII
jgi:hypothetical protein